MVEGSNPFFMPNGNKESAVDYDWTAFDQIWEPLDQKLEGIYADFRSILSDIRAQRRIPMDKVRFSIYECTGLNQEIDKAKIIGELDFNELKGRHAYVSKSLTYLNDVATLFRVPTAAETSKIVGGYQSASNAVERIQELELELWLILLARPKGKEFWDLVRALWERLQSETGLEDARMIRKVGDLRRILRWVAPSRIFKEKSEYYPSNRYGHRTTSVEWIVPAGAPGLGKRA